MRRILNFFIMGLILWVATKFFPTHVQIKNFGVLALAVILFWLIEVAITVFCLLIMAFGAAFERVSWIILSVIIAIACEFITICILDAKLDGFTVIGFWPKAIIALTYSLLYIKAPSKD